MWYTLLSILLFVVGSFLLGLFVGRMRREVITDDADFQTSRRYYAREKELDAARRRISALEAERDRLLEADRIRRGGAEAAAALSGAAPDAQVDLSGVATDAAVALEVPVDGDIDLADAAAEAAVDLPDPAADATAVGIDLPDVDPHPVDVVDGVDLSERAIDAHIDVSQATDVGVWKVDPARATGSNAPDSPYA